MTKTGKSESIRALATSLRSLVEGAKPYEVEAQKMGAAAFKAGKKRAPALDPEINKMLGTLDSEVAGSKAHQLALKAWLRGWDAENLKD